MVKGQEHMQKAAKNTVQALLQKILVGTGK